VGLVVPGTIRSRLSEHAATLPDTDWYVDELYRFAPAMGAGLMTARHSRYVVDLNRPPDDVPLYDGSGTSLVPLTTFRGESVYRAGQAPGSEEVRDRVERYWRPYHEALAQELERLRAAHGWAVLLDAHSIAGRLPMLFEGRLPDLNLGTDDGRSAAPSLERGAFDVLQSGPYSTVLNGRFKGGYITRHYGRPLEAIHALQLEMAQRVYLSGLPPRVDRELAGAVSPVLQRLVGFLLDTAPVSGQAV
jgi:N-formylglutamate deformylase